LKKSSTGEENMLGKNRCVTALLIGLFALQGMVLNAQVEVRKKASGFAGNPTLMFKGINGDTALASAVNSNLAKCGWFKVVKGYADYTVSGSASQGSLTMSILDKGSRSFNMSIRYDSRDPRRTAHIVVDSILKRLFADSKVQGICSSKVAFCVETRKGIKEIYVADFDGMNVTPVTQSNTLSVEPDWVPGKMNLVYTKYGRSFTDIVETDLVTKRSRRIAQYPGLNSGAAISPDGKTIALTLSRDGQVELYKKPIDKRGQQRLTSSRSVEASPCWSPDGRMICFVSNKSGRPKLYITGANGQGSRVVSTIGEEAVSPDWNYANKIVYAARIGSNYKIAVADVATGQSRLIVGGVDTSNGNLTVKGSGGDWESPSWAPDNRHVICSRTVAGKSSLVVIDSWSGDYREFVRSPNNLTLPSWSNLY